MKIESYGGHQTVKTPEYQLQVSIVLFVMMVSLEFSIGVILANYSHFVNYLSNEQVKKENFVSRVLTVTKIAEKLDEKSVILLCHQLDWSELRTDNYLIRKFTC